MTVSTGSNQSHRHVQLLIENVRCFGGRHTAPLAPLTILVGENSSGKSTFLAAASYTWSVTHGSRRSWNDFNEAPFLLGSYAEIATRTNDTGGGNTEHFGLGYAVPARTPDNRKLDSNFPDTIELLVNFKQRSGQPMLDSWTMSCGPVVAKSSISPKVDQAGGAEVNVRAYDAEFVFEIPPFGIGMVHIGGFWGWVARQLREESDPKIPGFRVNHGRVGSREIDAADMVFNSVMKGAMRSEPYATAPIRSRPRRTYDPTAVLQVPEGDHVPMLLSKLHLSDPNQWSKLSEKLDSFGTASGLFDHIDIKRFGASNGSTPFQLEVSIGGGAFNILDVGYGVGQSLPILVDCLTKTQSLILLQQPEVHLHPRAQAELGSVLAQLAGTKSLQNQYIVETHSDYIIDRIRMDVRDGRTDLSPEDIAILFFDRSCGSVQIHEVHIDDHGNIYDAPEEFRSFFLEEERRLLGTSF